MGNFIAAVAFVPMVVTPVISGVNSGKYLASYQQQAADVIKQTADMKHSWDVVYKSGATIDQGLMTNTTNTIQKISQLAAQMELSQQGFQNELKKIEIASVISITLVFFLLILKQFDLLPWEK